ncbi:MAG TPA: molecular chaperone TorD family protein [Burkholderiales bacterium]
MTQAMQFVPTLPPEEVARANFYGLLARLFYAPPDASLLEALAGADEIDAEDGGIGEAWLDLARAAAAADADALREEYESAFVGTGKAPVSLYASAYTIRYSNEVPLAALRAELAALGLARREGAHEPEDHIAALCDVMRHLVAEQKLDLVAQARFFGRWIGPAAEPLCDAISKHPGSEFYRRVGLFAKCFFALEQSAFEML